MNEILSNDLSEECPRDIGIVFMRYIIQILFRESADFTAQYPYEHRSLPRCAILGYIYKNE